MEELLNDKEVAAQFHPRRRRTKSLYPTHEPVAGLSLASRPPTCPAPNRRFGGSLFVSRPGSLLASAEAVNCYLDESATDGSTPQAVVGGVLLDRGGFVGFDMEWREFINARGLAPGLHIRDFGRKGRFSRVSNTDKSDIFADAVRMINQHKIYSVAATISHDKYRTILDLGTRQVMSVYGLCFILSAYENHRRAVFNKYTKNIGFILDSGNPYAGHVVGAHATLLECQKSEPLNVGSLTFDQDDNVTALQAADVVAWSVRRRLVGMPFNNGYEPLVGIFDEAHSEQSWDGDTLQPLAHELARVIACDHPPSPC